MLPRTALIFVSYLVGPVGGLVWRTRDLEAPEAEDPT